MEAIETYEHAGLTVEIHVIQEIIVKPCTQAQFDESPDNPRKWDNAGKLVIYPRGNYMEVNELDMTFRPEDYSGWDELDQNVMECYPKAEVLPVFRYEHSGVVYNTIGFSAYDSHGCRVGFILCDRETMLKEWGKKIITPKIREQARKCMNAEIECFSQWANGEVYGYIIKDENGNDFPDGFTDSESCWGFYGLDYVKQEAESIAESLSPKWKEGRKIRQMYQFPG